MIRINLTDIEKYARIRDEYFKRVQKYLNFNENNKKDLDRCLPGLYMYLFGNSEEINQKHLRYLLIGPDNMPKSFGGNGSEDTMQMCFENIKNKYLESKVSKERIKECCKKIFRYEVFSRNKNDAYWLLNNLDTRVCPYCNRIYTTSLIYEEDGKKNTRAALDHYYSQDEYPYFALSLFNLIPCCYVCNMNKLNSKKNMVYPYDEEFGKEAVFRVVPDLSKGKNAKWDILHGESDQFYIKFMGKGKATLLKDEKLDKRLSDIENETLKEHIKASIEELNLERLYQEHKMEIMDILRNRYYFDEQYVKTVICPMLRQKMKMEGNNQGTTSEDVLEDMAMDMIFFRRIRQEEWGKRSLSKLVSDLLEQYPILEITQL